MIWYGFRFDPIPPLLSSPDPVIRLRAARDLEGRPVDLTQIPHLPVVRKTISKQMPDGSWRYPGKRTGPTDYEYLETYRKLGELVELYVLDKGHPSVRAAAEFLLGLQTGDGDIRGIYGNQYSPNYTAGVLEVLIHAGYGDDTRVDRGLEWLMSMRQDDGGWAIPIRTTGWKFRQPFPAGPEPIAPDRTKPSSHMVTGIVLRAMAANDHFRSAKETRLAAEILSSQLFLADRYPDRGGKEFWNKFTFPFWFTDLISALDSLSLIGIRNERVDRAIDWFRSRQREDGTWRLYYLKGAGISIDEWVHFALCRALRRYWI